MPPAEPENSQEDLGSSVVWENERHVLGFGWLPPVPLERPNFTDAEGRNVGQPWSVLAGGDWAVFVDDGTDLDGWQYGSYFQTLKKDRPGGRASMRITDGVRSRKWTKLCDPDAAAGRLAHQADEAKGLLQKGQRGSRTAVKGRSLGASPHTDAAVSYGGTVLDRPDAKMRALRGFFELLRNALADKGLSGIPMDPLSYAVLIKKHTKDTRELQARIEEAHRMRGEGDHVCESMRRLMRDASVRSEADGPKDAGGAAQQAAEGRCTDQGEQEPPMLSLDDHPSCRGLSGDSEAVSKLLPELEAAVVYSRAAYGYALSAGYLSSVHSAIFMGTLKNIQFDVAGGASAEANNKALMMETGVQESDLLLTEWRNSVCRPCHFLAADRKRGRLILSIRGSLELADLMTDGKAESMEVPLGGLDGKVHEGFFAAATFVHCNTHSVLAEASEMYPGWPLLVTGHSLGGGVAALLAMLLNEPGGCPPGLEGRVRCVAVACPSVACGALSRAAAPYVTSLIFRNDFVPRLSAANIDLLMQELVEASPIRNLTKNIGDFFTSSFAGKPGGSGSGSDGNSGVELQQWREDHGASVGPLQPDTACLGPGAFTPWWMMAAPNSAEAAALAEPFGSLPWPPPDMPPLSAKAALKERQQDKDASKATPVELRPTDAERDSAAESEAEAHRHEEAAEVAAAAFEANTGIHISTGDAAPHEEKEAAAGEGSGAKGNQCPHGTGGVTKFDLLHPAGRCLWIVKAEERNKNSSCSNRDNRSTADQGGEPVTGKRSEAQGPTDTTRDPADAGTSKDSPTNSMKRDNSSQRILDMMEQAWNSSGFGGGGTGSVDEAPVPKKKPVDQRLEEACREAASPSSSDGGGGGAAGTSSNGAKAEALKTPIAELPWRVRFLECPPETFGRLHLNPEMINDHLPDSYASAVGQLTDWWRHRQQLEPETDEPSAGGICIGSTAEGGGCL